MEKELIGVTTMGMSASQVRLLSLTSRMHDLEFQAQGIHYAKLDLATLEAEAYDEYLEAMDSTKLQMNVVTASGKDFKDVNYSTLINQSAGIVKAMYAVTNVKGEIMLPAVITEAITPDTLESMDDFLEIVASKYLYSGRADLSTKEEYFTEMRKDGNFNYWQAIYHQIVGYQNQDGKYVGGAGFASIYMHKLTDRDWLMEGINNAELFLNKLTSKKDESEGQKINIFAQVGVANDEDLFEAKSEELVDEARSNYEKQVKEIDIKESKLDLTLSQIDSQHHALKTEYDSVKQIVSKNVERSFKTFNA